MGFKFTDAGRYPYQAGGFFLGIDEHGREVGINTERHLITVAGAGSGKGATLIIPNLKRWRGSCVVIDPKGENATVTAGDRRNMGQTVGVIDPYEDTKGPAAALRCSINPLSLLDPESRTFRADLEAIGDGLIRRFDAKHSRWDNAAAAMLAGAVDYVLAVSPPEERTLKSVRGLFLLPPDDLKAVAKDMLALNTAGGAAREAGALLLMSQSNTEGVEAGGFGIAIRETGWIDDPAFASILGGDELPPFDLRTLKAGTGSLYLCIRPSYLDTRGGFLRLFVRMGLMTMMSDLAEHGGGGRCLFLLDEFHSLGKVDLVAKAAGLMRGYGVQLWPFLQDMGQLESLYGDNEMHTFFANADARIFFGNSDKPTLEYVSGMIGPITADEIGQAFITPSSRHLDGLAEAASRNHQPMPTDPKQPYGFAALSNDIAASLQNSSRAKYERKTRQHQESVADVRAKYDHKMRAVGSPRIEPSAVAEMIGKKDRDSVSPSAIVFAKGGDVLKVRLQPYFERGASSASTAAPAMGSSGFNPKQEMKAWAIAAMAVILIYIIPLPAIVKFLANFAIFSGTMLYTVYPRRMYFESFSITVPTFIVVATATNELGMFLGFPNNNSFVAVVGIAASAYAMARLSIWYRRRIGIL